jgi:hypothetical protein
MIGQWRLFGTGGAKKDIKILNFLLLKLIGDVVDFI